MSKKRLDRRGGISRANDLALLAAGIETGWWDEHGVPAPWPEDFFDPNSGWHQPTPATQPATNTDTDQPAF